MLWVIKSNWHNAIMLCNWRKKFCKLLHIVRSFGGVFHCNNQKIEQHWLLSYYSTVYQASSVEHLHCSKLDFVPLTCFFHTFFYFYFFSYFPFSSNSKKHLGFFLIKCLRIIHFDMHSELNFFTLSNINFETF